MRYFDLLVKRKKNRDKYLKNMDYYLKAIKEFFKREFGEVEIFLFGSILRDDFGPNSDVDILVVSKNAPEDSLGKAKLIAKIKDEIGFVNPFEFHIITPEIYDEWYSSFIKEKKKV